MSFTVSIESNLAELNTAIQHYAILSRKTVQEALQKQAVKLGFMLRQELRGIAPPKGSIREQLLSRLRSGQGIRVSEPAKKRFMGRNIHAANVAARHGKDLPLRATKKTRGLNLWAALVREEINLRESASGFLGVSGRYQGLTGTSASEARAMSRYGPVLSTAGFKVSPDGGSFEFHWGGGISDLSTSAAEGISKPKGDAAINRALVNTAEDIEVYIDRKLQEAWR